MLFAEAAGGFKSTTRSRRPRSSLPPSSTTASRGSGKEDAVRVRVNLKATVSDRDVDGLNIIGEIPGGAKKDEIVMIGAHFDSWHSRHGRHRQRRRQRRDDRGDADPEGAESASCAARFASALWSGEEQGLLGSRAYVKEHFADPQDDEGDAGARQALRLLQPGQRQRQDPRRLSAGATMRCGRSSRRGWRRSATWA